MELARELFEERTDDEERRRILALCGMNPELVLAERDARPIPTPGPDAQLQRALAFATEDAARSGHSQVGLENLLIGMLRAGGPLLEFLKDVGRIDVERVRSELADRLAPTEKTTGDPKPPMHAGAQEATDAAIALAATRRRENVRALHLLHALTRRNHGPVFELLARYGTDVARIHAVLEKGI
jgi:ATP-dependent Clp protease ATP-binding subunit ClpA